MSSEKNDVYGHMACRGNGRTIGKLSEEEQAGLLEHNQIILSQEKEKQLSKLESLSNNPGKKNGSKSQM